MKGGKVVYMLSLRSPLSVKPASACVAVLQGWGSLEG